MFNSSKYTKIYFNLMNSRKGMSRDCYLEKHHIIPSSLGGLNDHSNIVALTAREHFIAHMLLIRMLDDVKYKNKMRFALHRLSNNHSNNLKNNSLMYEKARIENFKALNINVKY